MSRSDDKRREDTTLLDVIRALPYGISNAGASSICMRFLMRKQYGDHPPNPCPCY